MKIIVVDDSSTMRRIIKNTLARIGDMEVYEGENGLDGWNVLNQHSDAGMLITDWNMPDMNGLELVTKVRADPRFANLPIIMITTEGGKAQVITALKAGVNNYIVKPFTPDVLREKLSAVLGVSL